MPPLEDEKPLERLEPEPLLNEKPPLLAEAPPLFGCRVGASDELLYVGTEPDDFFGFFFGFASSSSEKPKGIKTTAAISHTGTLVSQRRWLFISWNFFMVFNLSERVWKDSEPAMDKIAGDVDRC